MKITDKIKKIADILVAILIGIVFINVLWIVFYYIGKQAMYLLDYLMGFPDIIQAICLELFFPGIIMNLLTKLLPGDSMGFLTCILSLVVFFILFFFFGDLLISPIYFQNIGEVGQTIFKVGFIISIIVGAFLGVASSND